MSEDIELVERQGVMEIHFNRPDKKNALTAAMYDAVTAALGDAARRADIGAVLFAGRGDAFSAGNDLKDFLAGPQGGDAAFAFILALADFEKPVVAAVNGLAVGVGTTMLFHCDLVYASPAAHFLMLFVDLGLVPEAGTVLLAPATMGYAKAAAMLLLGEPMNADAADRAGLISAIVPAEDLLDHARSKAAALAAKPPQALAMTRTLLRGDRNVVRTRILEEADLFRAALTSPEAIEAFSAFVQKRPPSFRQG